MIGIERPMFFAQSLYYLVQDSFFVRQLFTMYSQFILPYLWLYRRLNNIHCGKRQ